MNDNSFESVINIECAIWSFDSVINIESAILSLECIMINEFTQAHNLLSLSMITFNRLIVPSFIDREQLVLMICMCLNISSWHELRFTFEVG